MDRFPARRCWSPAAPALSATMQCNWRNGAARASSPPSARMKAEQARIAGADLVINYRTEDVVAKAIAFTGQRGVDRVIDVDFGGNLATTLKLMAVIRPSRSTPPTAIEFPYFPFAS